MLRDALSIIVRADVVVPWRAIIGSQDRWSLPIVDTMTTMTTTKPTTATTTSTTSNNDESDESASEAVRMLVAARAVDAAHALARRCSLWKLADRVACLRARKYIYIVCRDVHVFLYLI